MSSHFDLACDQGADLAFIVTYVDADGAPINLTGGLARMMARNTYSAATPFLSIDSAALGGITLGGALGTMTVEIPASKTKDFPHIPSGVYDIEFVDVAGKVGRVIEGKFAVHPEVTK